jgi:hypothetical protein
VGLDWEWVESSSSLVFNVAVPVAYTARLSLPPSIGREYLQQMEVLDIGAEEWRNQTAAAGAGTVPLQMRAGQHTVHVRYGR